MSCSLLTGAVTQKAVQLADEVVLGLASLCDLLLVADAWPIIPNELMSSAMNRILKNLTKFFTTFILPHTALLAKVIDGFHSISGRKAN